MISGVLAEARPTIDPGEPMPAERGRRRRRSLLAPYLYVAPGLLVLGMWTYVPLLWTAWISGFSWNLSPTSPATWVGLENYRRLVDDDRLASSIWLTISMVLGMLAFTVLLPVAVALAAQRTGGRSTRVYQAIAFAPMVVPPVAGAAVWAWLLAPRTGMVNTVTGLDVNWLNDPRTAPVAIVIIAGWHVFGFAVLIAWAGISTINPAYGEAASVDGARPGQVTRWITLPLLSPTIGFLVLITVLLTAQLTFPLIDTLTHGGPVDSTTHVYYLLWDLGFHTHDAGRAAAAGVVLFAGFLVVAGVMMSIIDRLVHHDA